MVFLHNGDVIRGVALNIHEDILQIKTGESTSDINVKDICDVFGVLKAEGV